MSARSCSLPTLEATAPRALTLYVGPIPVTELPQWSALLARLPAVAAVDVRERVGETVKFTVQTHSVTRLHAQLRHLAERVEASFAATLDGALGLRMHPVTAPPFTRDRHGLRAPLAL